MLCSALIVVLNPRSGILQLQNQIIHTRKTIFVNTHPVLLSMNSKTFPQLENNFVMWYILHSHSLIPKHFVKLFFCPDLTTKMFRALTITSPWHFSGFQDGFMLFRLHGYGFQPILSTVDMIFTFAYDLAYNFWFCYKFDLKVEQKYNPQNSEMT